MELVPESVVKKLNTDSSSEGQSLSEISLQPSPSPLKSNHGSTVVVEKPSRQSVGSWLAQQLQAIDPVFYFSVIFTSTCLVVGLYFLTAYSNRLGADRLNDIEVAAKLIEEKIAHSKTAINARDLQPIQTQEVEREAADPDLKSLVSNTATVATGENLPKPTIVTDDEVDELQRVLAEKDQQLALLSLENHELRLQIAFGQSESTEPTQVAPLATEPNQSQQELQVAEMEDLLAQAVGALERNDHIAAAHWYGVAVQQDPVSREANLGVASVALLLGQLELATDRYRHLLNQNPYDQSVFASFLALAAENNMIETELRGHIRQLSKDKAAFYSLLGDYFGRQQRWTEANTAFSNALVNSSAGPVAELLFNLAVSSEHIGSIPKAIDYYQRVLLVDESSGVDRASVQRRLSELKK